MSDWPNFFIVGAQKSGTTSMYHYLRKNPKIFLSPIKEPAYFSQYRGSIPFKEHSPTKEQYLELFQNVLPHHSFYNLSILEFVLVV